MFWRLHQRIVHWVHWQPHWVAFWVLVPTSVLVWWLTGDAGPLP